MNRQACLLSALFQLNQQQSLDPPPDDLLAFRREPRLTVVTMRLFNFIAAAGVLVGSRHVAQATVRARDQEKRSG